jgi:peroxiredoxin
VNIPSWRRLFCVLFALAVAIPAQEEEGEVIGAGRGWKQLNGEDVLEISAKHWLNTGDQAPSIQALQGKVWLLEFFATWCTPCMNKVDHLKSLHAKYHDVGFRIVAISTEPVETLRKKMIDSLGVKYCIGSDPEDTTSARFLDKGAAGIPHAYLVGADGKVIAERFPTDKQVRDMLENVHLVDKALSAKLARARALYDARAFGAAHRIAAGLRQDKDSAVAADAGYLCEKVGSHGQFLQKIIAADPQRDVNVRYGEILRFALEFEGLEPVKWAQGELNTLKKHDRVKPFLTEWSKLENAMRAELMTEGKADKVRAVRLMYDEIAKKYAQSLVGKLAAENAARLAK